MTTERAMPMYQCHKIVRALKIMDIIPKENPDKTGRTAASSYGASIVPADEGFGTFAVDAEYVMRHKPHAGGYYVVYEDGYESFSPAEAFESGYTRLDQLQPGPIQHIRNTNVATQAQVRFKRVGDHDLPLPSCGSAHAAGIDLRANLQPNADLTMRPGDGHRIPTGFAIEIPPGHVGLLLPRSSLGLRGFHLMNTVGVIDSDYRGEVIVTAYNATPRPFDIDHGERIAQLVIVPSPLSQFAGCVEVEELSETARGAGGFGSTGSK